MNLHIEHCPVYSDDRGDLIQFVTNDFLQKSGTPFGQIYLLTFTGRDKVRGNHYHNHSSEMFCLISGSVHMIFEDVDSHERIEKVMTIENNQFIRLFIGTRIAHSLKSISDFAVVVSFSSKEYDANEEDKIPYPLG